MNRYAISFTVKPGSESAVAEVLRGYRRPPAGTTPGGPPLLRRTSVFMAGQRVVRVMDVDGDIGAVMRHLASQPQIRAVEQALDPHLSTPRNLDSPEGVRAFLHQALLSPARPESAAPPAGPEQPVAQRCGLLYPVRAGRGEPAARLLAGAAAYAGPAGRRHRIAAASTFRRGDVLVGLLDVDGDVEDALDQLARGACRAPTAAALADIVETSDDLTTPQGFREFLTGCQMELLTDRRVGVPA